MIDPRALGALPTEPSLRRMVEAAAPMLNEAAPLSLGLLGAVPPLPDVAPERVEELVAAMAEVAAGLEGLGPLRDADDEVDRRCLAHGLRRALDAVHRGTPDGPAALEQHLQLRLLRLLEDPGTTLPALVELVEFGPAFLRQSRPRGGGWVTGAGRLAVEAAGRLPLLLDACAAAGRELASAPLRFRLEAALGALLQAGAEESGWLLKEYLPGASDLPPSLPDVLKAGLGMSLADLEAAAEAALTEAVLADVPPVTDGQPLVDLEDARRAWQAAVASGVSVGADVTAGADLAAEIEVLTAPSWLAPLLPGLSLALPGPLEDAPPRLLVTAGAGSSEDVGLLYRCEYLPWAMQRTRPRAARMLLPSPDLGAGWRAHVRTASAVGQPPWPRELAWRAALALAAISMAVRGTTVEQAAGLVAAESGMAEQGARLQCLHLRRRPLDALTFLAGRAAVAAAVTRVGPAAVLSAGPLPAAAISHLA